MRFKQVLFLALIGLIGIAIGLAGFLFAPKTYGNSANSGVILTGLDYKIGVVTSSRHSAIPNDREFFDALFKYVQSVTDLSDTPFSAILPHHLVAGSYEIGMLEAMSKKITPSIVVIISPNHFETGHASLITAIEPWQTPYGVLETNKKIINKLTDIGVIIDDPAMQNEHGIGALVSLINKIWPNTKLVPVITRNARDFDNIDKLAQTLNDILPSDALVLASVDFSHYMPLAVADWHDQMSINVLETGDYNRLERMEIDSQNSVRLLLKYNELKKTQKFTLAHHTNSAVIGKNLELVETTSHVMGYFTNGIHSLSPLFKGENKEGVNQLAVSPLTTIQFFGDMMLDRNVAKAMGEKGLDYVFEKLKGQENRFFYGADLFVANLEGPFAPARIKTSKSIAFRFDPGLAKQLKRYNFSAFSLANNHAFDMGRANFDFTKTILEQNNLGYFGNEYGVSKNDIWVAGPEQNLPEKVAFVGLNFTESAPSDSEIKNIVAEAKKLADNVVVVPHWGQEYDRISNTTERNRAHLMIDAGAATVIGGHPHVIQEMEIYQGKPIFYSLGNFVFDQYFSKDTQEGLSVGLTFASGTVKNIYVFPMYSVKSQNYLMTSTRRDEFFEWFNKNSRLDGKKFENSKIEL